jgi:hypothetical protein
MITTNFFRTTLSYGERVKTGYYVMRASVLGVTEVKQSIFFFHSQELSEIFFSVR